MSDLWMYDTYRTGSRWLWAGGFRESLLYPSQAFNAYDPDVIYSYVPDFYCSPGARTNAITFAMPTAGTGGLDNGILIYGGQINGEGPLLNDMWAYVATRFYWAWIGGGEKETRSDWNITPREGAAVSSSELGIMFMWGGYNDNGGMQLTRFSLISARILFYVINTDY